jgi:cell division protein FtsB
MVTRRRLRAILLPLALYAASGAASSYFLWHAMNGNRGMKAKVEFRETALALSRELAELKAERAGFERRIAMMRAQSVERDILEEEARRQLGRVHHNDVVVFLPKIDKPAAPAR